MNVVAAVSPEGSCSLATEPRAAVTAASEAWPRSVPSRTAAISTGSAAWTAASDASSGRTRIEQGPAAVRGREQDRVQPADPRVARRPGQVDLGLKAAGLAPPPDPQLVPCQLEPAFGAVSGEGDVRAVRTGRRPHLLVV